MPTRSIRLKLVIPRDSSPESTSARRALYATHAFANEAASYYTQLLLEMRQEAVCIGQDAQGVDVIEGSEVWKGRLRKRLAARGLLPEAIEKALPLLQKVYRNIVSVKGSNGDGGSISTQDRAWHGPLVDPESTGQSKNRDPEIVQLAAQLRAVRALPLVVPYGKGRVQSVGVLTDHERAGMALAAEALASWETKSQQCRIEKERRVALYAQWQAFTAKQCQDALKAIRQYEAARQNDIVSAGQARPGQVYRIGRRALRCWAEVRRALLSCPAETAEARAQVVGEVQAQHPRDFGDPHLFLWASHPDQRWLVHQEEPTLSRIGQMNQAEIRATRARQYPQFTFPDARRSPRRAKLGKTGDNNAPGYALSVVDGRLAVSLTLLELGPGGLLCSRKRDFFLAPQRQLDHLKFAPLGESNPRGLHISWRRQDRTGRTVGELQGGNLLLDRNALNRIDANRLHAGDVGNVWLQLAIDVNSKNLNPDLYQLARRRRAVSVWLNAAIQNRGKKKGEVPWPGYRVMGVDLGLRTAATVSVFTINPPPGTRLWPLSSHKGPALTASYERTLSLSLPGERPTSREQKAREEKDKEIEILRSRLRGLRLLTQASKKTTEEQRIAALGELERVLPKSDASQRGISLLRSLAKRSDAEVWLLSVRNLYREVEREVGKEVQGWRKNNRGSQEKTQSQMPGGKLSMWRVRYLDRSVKFLRAWNARARPGQTALLVPSDDAASRLRKHTNRLREQRIRQTADLIVQAARGYVYRDGCWKAELPPCDLIVMEDLRRYQFASDRAPWENSQLMRWCHRGIREAVEQQAEAEGIPVADVGAGYTSRFDPLTKAPGLRCHGITAEDKMGLVDPQHWLWRCLSRYEFDVSQLQPGDLIPDDGGQVLVTLRGDKLHAANADKCAAQNLVVRYLESYTTLYRVSGQVSVENGRRCLHVDVESRGARLQGAFDDKHVCFTEDDDGTWSLTSYPAGRLRQETRGGTDSIDLDEEGEATSPYAGRGLVLFRDPSGALFGGRWVESHNYWSAVKNTVAQALVKKNKKK